MSEEYLRTRDEFINQTNKCITYKLVYKQCIYIYIAFVGVDNKLNKMKSTYIKKDEFVIDIN